MTYCRATIHTPARGQVYKKDFDAQHVFGPLVRTLASDLITQGIVQEGEHYTARITPRYTDQMRREASVYFDRVGTSTPDHAGLTLSFCDKPGTPLTFFTVELRFQETGLVYNRAFQITNLHYLWYNLQTVLLRAGVLNDGDVYMPRLCIRDDDDQANFMQEDVNFETNGTAPLVEVVTVEDADPAFPARTLDQFNIVATQDVPCASLVELADGEQVEQDDVHILITEHTLATLRAIAGADVQAEQGGVLVGNVYHAAGQYLVAITDYIAAESAEANLVTLRYTFDSWLNQSARLREQFPGKRIVGWYHTHLIQAQVPVPGGTVQATEFFFSQDDCFMHRQFFNEAWYVAMVLNPAGDAAFFRWFGDKISTNRRYHVIEAD